MERPTTASGTREERILAFLDEADEPVRDGSDPPPGGPGRLGTMLGGCRLEALLGRGGMGEVYRAHHVALDKTVAVKVIAPVEGGFDPALLDRFRIEARLAARIDSPHVVATLHADFEDGVPFLVMAYVEGESLEARLVRTQRLPADKTIEIARAVARGLATAHAAGVVHRDVKPANILLAADGAIKVVDFGVGRDIRGASGPTDRGAFLGTLPYTAPEQLDSASTVDGRADLYALGATLYRCLAGRPPHEHEGKGVFALVKAILEDRPPSLAQVAPEVPPELGEIIERLLEKSPARRFRSAEELLDALDGKPVTRPREPSRARFWIAGAGGVAILLAAGLSASVLWRASDPEGDGSGAKEEASGSPATAGAREALRINSRPRWISVWIPAYDLSGQGRLVFPAPVRGWTSDGILLSGEPGADALRFQLPLAPFSVDVVATFPEAGSGLSIAYGASEARPEGEYLVRWKPGESLEWRCLRTGSVLARTDLGSGSAGRGQERIRIGWFEAAVLAAEWGDGKTLLARDPEPLRFGAHDLSIRPDGGAVEIRSLRIEIPLRRP